MDKAELVKRILARENGHEEVAAVISECASFIAKLRVVPNLFIQNQIVAEIKDLSSRVEHRLVDSINHNQKTEIEEDHN